MSTYFFIDWCSGVLRRFWEESSYNHSANLNTAPMLLGMHLTSIGRGCNMILDMSPTSTGLLQTNDVETYVAMGNGIEKLYGHTSLVADAGAIARGQATVQVVLPHTIMRGAIELRENLSHGQAISSYNVSHLNTSRGGRAPPAGVSWEGLPLRNQGQLTIGNRRIQYWDGIAARNKIRVDVETLRLASGEATVPHLRSVRVFDWGSAELDDLLAYILKVK